MVIKEFIGLHLEKDFLHYCCAVRTVSSWAMAVSGSSMEPFGIIQGNPHAALREFLLRISPRHGRQIHVTLPRNRFFIRDLQLPPLALEDALMSVQSALPVMCHLALDEIFYDVFLCRMPNEQVNALIIYVPRKEIIPILDIFREIGHENSLVSLSPFSLGIGAWLRLMKHPMPMALEIPVDTTAFELTVYQQSGAVFSILKQESSDEGENQLVREAAIHKFQLTPDVLYRLEDLAEGLSLQEPSKNRLPWLPSIRTNPGVAALSIALSDQQKILLNGYPPRIKIVSLWKIFVPIVLVLSSAIFIWTFFSNQSIDRQVQRVSVLKEETQHLQQQLRPLEKKRDALKKAESLSADIDDFIRLRPHLFSCFNEIARLVPEGTWFSRASLQGANLTLQGQSKDALKIVESLRSSPLFEQVKLAGSVSRNPTGVEQFSLSIRLKETEESS